MSSVYEKLLIEPPLSEWPSVRCVLQDEKLQALRDSARRRLLQAAIGYRSRLLDIGRAAGFFHEPLPVVSGDPDSLALVMTGHQPVIFHSGLTFKYQTTEQFAVDHNALIVAVVIDTDEGDAGAFSFPDSETPFLLWPESAAAHRSVSKAGSLRTSAASFGAGSSLFSAGRRKSPEVILEEGARVVAALDRCGCHSEAEKFRRVVDQYAVLKTDSMMEANLIVRWSEGVAGRTPEIPLSIICSFPEVFQFFAAILSRPFEFARCYNETLDAFRQDHRIRNVANPFPNLRIEDSRCELPFWLIDSSRGTREIVSIRENRYERFLEANGVEVTEIFPGNESASLFSLMVGGCQLIPRGGLITSLLRILFSDLFVHGTGGGRYDLFTSQFIQKWWKIEPTPFAVASASRYLFDQERHQLGRLQEIATNLRDYQFNPQRYIGHGVFKAETERSLRETLAEKDAAVEALKKARAAGSPADDIGRTIQRLGDSVKKLVSDQFADELERLNSVSDATVTAVNSRTWPWFFFA